MLVLRRKQRPTTITTEMVSSQSASCRLLALPAELRFQIWELLFIHNQLPPSRPRPPRPQLRSQPAVETADATHEEKQNATRFCARILVTCRQINAEGTPILYGENIFLAHSSLLTTLPAFLLVLRPVRVALPPVVCTRVVEMIRKFYIHVRLDTDPRFTRAQATESFSNLVSLEIEVSQAMYGSCDLTMLKLFEGVRGVGSAIVQGSIGDGAYARHLERCMMTLPEAEPPEFDERLSAGLPSWDSWAQGNR